MISPRLCLVFMALSRSLEKYSATGAVENTFTSILLLCVQKHTLYSTIAKWPAHCLNLGIALKSRLVYDEAFKHLVGDGANSKEGKAFLGLLGNVQAIAQRRVARALLIEA